MVTVYYHYFGSAASAFHAHRLARLADTGFLAALLQDPAAARPVRPSAAIGMRAGIMCLN